MDSTCPIKLLHAQSRRRARLDVPLRMAQLRAQIAESFPELGAATVEYVDEEGDVVVVMSDAELEEAQRVYVDLGRVLSFVVRPAAEEKGGDTETRENTKVLHAKLAHAKAHSTAKAAHTEAAAETEASPLSGTPFGPGSFGPGVVRLQHALIKLGHMRASAIRWRAGFYGPRTTDAVAKVARDLGSKDKAELAGVFTQSIRAELLDQLRALESGELVLHHGITCDGSGEQPLRGVRYHKIGCDYDLNGTEFAKLSPAEQRAYEAIERPDATPVPVSVGATKKVHAGAAPETAVIPAAIRTLVESIHPAATKASVKASKSSEPRASRQKFFGHPLARALMTIFSQRADAPVVHFGVTCDGSNEYPLVGTRYHKIGQNYDLNAAEFAKLSLADQRAYEAIEHPGATPVPVNFTDPSKKVSPEDRGQKVGFDTAHNIPGPPECSSSETAAAPNTAPGVQTLVDMGFDLPAETLDGVLLSVNGNVGAAVAKLLG